MAVDVQSQVFLGCDTEDVSGKVLRDVGILSFSDTSIVTF